MNYSNLSSNEFSFIDYVGFVKRLLTLMHKGYKCLSKLEIELKQLEKIVVKPVNRGNTYLFELIFQLLSSSLSVNIFSFFRGFDTKFGYITNKIT